MKLQWLSWFSVAVNTTCAAVNCWLIYRNIKLRKREHAQYEEACKDLMMDVAPAIAFAVMMRDMPGAPNSIRQFAASVIPKNMEITTSPFQQTTGDKVH